jgi:hypothetical protein
VRADLAKGEVPGDLWAGVDVEYRGRGRNRRKIHKIRLPDKIAAIKADNDLAGEGSEAGMHDGLAEMILRIQNAGWPAPGRASPG